MEQAHGKHHRSDSDLDSATDLFTLLTDWTPPQGAARRCRSRVMRKLHEGIVVLQARPPLRPKFGRHDAGFIIRGRAA